MIIRLSQFGTLLISRPAGREAYLVAKAYILPSQDENIEIDFSDVKVVTPSWLDEFLTPIKKEYGERVKLFPTTNSTVIASLAIIEKSN